MSWVRPSRTMRALSRPPRRFAWPPARMPSVTSPASIIVAPLLALDVLHQPAPRGDLFFGQHVLLVRVRVLALAEEEADRRADQLEALAEEVLEVALVAVGQLLQARAVDDEGR